MKIDSPRDHTSSMRRLRVVLLAALTLTLGSVGGCAAPAGGQSGPAVVEMSADYPFFDSFADVVERSDAVVIGTVLESRSTLEFPIQEGGSDPSANPQAGVDNSTLSPKDRAAIGVPKTISRVRVTKSLSGGLRSGDVIEVSQVGGTIDGVSYRERSTSLLPESGYPEYVLALATISGSSYQLVDPVLGAMGKNGTAVRFLKPELAGAASREIVDVADVTRTVER